MATTKLFVLAAICVYVQAAPAADSTTANPLIAKVKKSVDKCKTDLSASPETVALMGVRTLPADDKQRCFLECVYKDMGVVKDNKFDGEVAKTLAAERYSGEELTKAHNTIEICAKEVTVAADNKDECAVGKEVRACFIKNGDEKLPPL